MAYKRRKPVSCLAAAEAVCRIAEEYNVWANKPPWDAPDFDADKFTTELGKALKTWKRRRRFFYNSRF